MTGSIAKGISWLQIVRLGLVQSSLGAIVMLVTSLLNRVMVVEIALPAAIPAGLVAWHYAIQLSRPRWGHAADSGRSRTPWIIGGMAVLAIGGVLATVAAMLMMSQLSLGVVLAVVAYTMIGAGVGASGTSLLALLAASVAPERRSAAASLTWVMMIAGIVITAGIASAWLEPFSFERLLIVCICVAATSFVVTLCAVYGIEASAKQRAVGNEKNIDSNKPQLPFMMSVQLLWRDPAARTFTVFIFVAMLAYSMQDLILEPMAGLIFGYTPSQSTALAGIQHQGVLLGMIVVGIGGRGFANTKIGSGGGSGGGAMSGAMRAWIVGGCAASALAIVLLGFGVLFGPGWPLTPTVFALGFANGVFAVAAISAMMTLAGADGSGHEGIRIGLWGAAQAIGFALGGFSGAAGFDRARVSLGSDANGFITMFLIEGALFALAAFLAFQIGRHPIVSHSSNQMVIA